MFNTRYLDELAWLREMGREFARAHPETGGMLAETGSDPDVERLLEGYAFLSARLRQKLDDELPELTHALIESLWPQYLLPVPSACVLQFESPRAIDAARRRIPRGTQVQSAPVDGTRCRFRTTADVEVAPLRVAGLTLAAAAPAKLSLKLKLHEGVNARSAGVQRLRLHFAGPQVVAAGLHLCLVRLCTAVHACAGGKRIALPAGCIAPAGLSPDDTLAGAPGSELSGHALLRDWFSFRERLLFADIEGLAAMAQLGEVNEVTLEFSLERVPDGLPQVSEGNILVGCTPAVNLFPHEADPVAVEAGRREYPVRPTGDDPTHFEVARVDSVAGIIPGTERPRPFQRLYQGGREPDPAAGTYLLRREPAVTGNGTRIAVVLAGRYDGVTALSMGLTCTNRRLPSALGPGDISIPGDPLPPGVRFRNLAKPTAPLPPPLGQQLEWRLLAGLGLGMRSLADAGALRSLLDLHDIRSLHDQQARSAHRRLVEAIESVAPASDTAVSGGALVRGVRIQIGLNGAGFDGEGDMHLFGMVIDEVLSQCAGMNSFTRLQLSSSDAGIDLRYAPRLGRRRLV